MQVDPRFVQRFCEKIDGSDSDECWEWTAARSSAGYGVIGAPGRRSLLLAHRVAWELINGSIPDGLLACHRCDNRGCVNPRHLFLGTIKDNAVDMAEKGRSTHGERNPNAKLTYEEVEAIRRLRSEGLTQKEIAGQFGISRVTVTNVVNRQTWSRDV